MFLITSHRHFFSDSKRLRNRIACGLYFAEFCDKIETTGEAIFTICCYVLQRKNRLACGLYFAEFCDKIETTGEVVSTDIDKDSDTTTTTTLHPHSSAHATHYRIILPF